MGAGMGEVPANNVSRTMPVTLKLYKSVSFVFALGGGELA
jgi:hypothetical protein